MLICTVSQAHHNRAGQITYQHVSGYIYEVSVTIIFYTPSVATIQRIQTGLSISWGDNTTSVIPCIEAEGLPDDVTKAVFRMRHTYPGPSVYTIIIEDSGRNAVLNIPNTDLTFFSIKAILRIDPNTGSHNSPQFLTNPIDKATLGQRFVHNPSAFDIDGDSLSYELAIPSGTRGIEIAKYSYPEASKELYLDPVTGDLIWDAPVRIGAYTIAIRVNKWRYGIKISSVIREMQIEVCSKEGVQTTTDGTMDVRESFKVYPNPTDNLIHFRLEKSSIVQLYDSSGKLIVSQKYDAGDVVINISQQPAGLYFLKTEKQTIKIVKQ